MQPRHLLTAVAGWIGNLVIGLFESEPTAPIPSQDYAVVIDRENGRVVLRRAGTEVPSASVLEELTADLEALSIRQFRTKWGISA